MSVVHLRLSNVVRLQLKLFWYKFDCSKITENSKNPKIKLKHNFMIYFSCIDTIRMYRKQHKTNWTRWFLWMLSWYHWITLWTNWIRSWMRPIICLRYCKNVRSCGIPHLVFWFESLCGRLTESLCNLNDNLGQSLNVLIWLMPQNSD